jgi:hypothetical protein
MPSKCLNEMLRQCDTSTVKAERQSDFRVRELIWTPRINAELSEEPGEPSSGAGAFLRAVATATCLPAHMNSEGQANTETLENVTNVVVVFVLVRRNRRGRCRCMRPRSVEQLPRRGRLAPNAHQ